MDRVSRKVYLAGKITDDNWREKLCPAMAYNDLVTMRETELGMVTGDACVGPFFVRDEHDCCGSWEEDTHAMMGCGRMDSQIPALRDTMRDVFGMQVRSVMDHREFVVECCKNWIRRANIVVAYISRSDIYGTLVEIGIAHAMGKPICIIYDSNFIGRKIAGYPTKGEHEVVDADYRMGGIMARVKTTWGTRVDTGMWFAEAVACRVTVASDILTGYNALFTPSSQNNLFDF